MRVIILFVIATIAAGSFIINRQNMCKVKFTPKEFGDIKEFRNISVVANACTPKIGPFDVNVININIPRKIIFTKLIDDSCVYIPMCMNYTITYKRALKYQSECEQIIHIKRVDEEIWHIGRIYEDRDPLTDNEFPIYPDGREKEEKMIQDEVKGAQKYPNDELNDSAASGETKNLNILQYVDIKLRNGKYEVYVTGSRLESNHCFVDVHFEES